MGTTNQKTVSSKEAKKLAAQARKQAEAKGMQPMSMKFYKPKGK